MHKKMLATAAAASTLGGAIAGATLLAPTLAGAQDDATTPPAVEDGARPEPGARVAEALQPLVDDGTLTEAQVDAVIQALKDARPEGRGHRGPGMPGGDAVAEALGMDPAEVRDALRNGSSLADLAEQQGVSTDDLVDAIVSATEERVNTALDNGRIDQDKADEILSEVETRAEAIVSGDFQGPGPRGHRGMGGPGGAGQDAPAPADA